MNAASQVEQILEHGKKQSTYKLALLRAIVEIIIERPAQEPRNGLHFVPLIDVALRLTSFYWQAAKFGVPQSWVGAKGDPSDRRGRISKTIADEVMPLLSQTDFELAEATNGLPFRLWVEGAESLPPALVRALCGIRQVIVEQPVRYLRNVQDRRLQLFSVFCEGVSPLASFEEHRDQARNHRRLTRQASWVELLDAEHGFLVLSARAWEELGEIRFWLQDAIKARWLRETEAICAADALWHDKGLRLLPSLLELSLPSRSSRMMNEARALFAAAGLDRCFYTGAPLGERFDVDHVLPWSRFPVDLFWNLVPARPEVNNAKRDRLPELSHEFLQRYRAHLSVVIASGHPAVFPQLGITWRRFFQEAPRWEALPAEAEVARRVESLFELSWRRVEMAGVGVWEA